MMKFSLLFIAFLCTCTLIKAQKLTGIWRGYFNSGYGYFKQQYKFEVQINQLTNNAAQKGVQGVTYSYHSTVFYGKATLQGIYDSKTKSITIRETKLVELKISDRSEPCLMTCYLDYHKEKNTEILEGNFTSINANSKGDCGSGYVYLERVQESDFHKEDFLLKKSTPSPPITKLKPPVTPPEAKNQSLTQQNRKNESPVVKKPSPATKTSKNSQSNITKKRPSKETETGTREGYDRKI